MEMGLLVAFWALSLTLVLTPGADWAYAISAGMRNRAIAPAVSGMLLGYVAITSVVAAGVGAIVASIPVMLTALTLVGASYLMYLGIGVFLNPPVPEAADAEATAWSNWLIRGFGVSGANPKALLLFLAILPQFTSQTSSWPVYGQIAALGVAHILNCAVIYTAVSASSRALLRTRPQLARLIGRTSGAAMILIALVLIIEQGMKFSL
jgi:threonine/homoserine/homoserine lactone efflux protein